MISNSVQFPKVETGLFSFSSRRGKKIPSRLVDWLEIISPTWTWRWKYQLYIQHYMDQITAGELEKLMLFIPPRHGKSEMVTVRYPVYRIEQNPKFRVIVGAYNQTLAEKFSRKSRRIAGARFVLSNERHSAEDWETPEGGGLRAVGVGAGITGQGGDLIIIDDPIKSREEANSKVYRDKVYDWYTDDLYTRREPGASMILIMTRWHEDDLAGRILASEDGPNWTVIKFPAEAEADDPLGRSVGEALNPDRYPLAELKKIRMVLQRSYYALYQQRPQEQEGEIFKRSWFGFVDEVPPGVVRARYWDKAATHDDGDYTVGVLMCRTPDGQFIIEDVVRGQWSTGERDRQMKATAEQDGKGVTIYWEEEGGSSGKDVSAALYNLFMGYTCHADRVTGDKATRAGPLASQCEAGNVKLMRGRWNEAYIDELTSFDRGAHDDQVDASSGAFNMLAVGGLDVY